MFLIKEFKIQEAFENQEPSNIFEIFKNQDILKASEIFENQAVSKAFKCFDTQEASENEYHGDMFQEVRKDVLGHSNISITPIDIFDNDKYTK